jgi:arsenite methyltransferase
MATGSTSGTVHGSGSGGTSGGRNRTRSLPESAAEVKRCCAAAYQSDWVRLLLGESFHPGGAALTRRLGEVLSLRPSLRVLDVASGAGAGAIVLAQTFGCEVVGVDYGAESVGGATAAAEAAGVASRVRFLQGDAEHLPIADASVDAIVCECAFCTFPDKAAAASEFARVLRPGGRVGLSDLTRHVETLPAELQDLLAWIACIADARPVEEYVGYLRDAGLRVGLVEPHDEALAELVHDIRTKLLGAELLLKLRQLDAPPGVDFELARVMARAAAEAVRARQFGYALVVATKGA